MAQVLRRRGRIQLRLNAEEREALRGLVGMLRPHTAKTPAATPKAYEDDAAAQADYARWIHGDLAKSREADLDYLDAGLGAGDNTLVLTESTAFTWLRALTHLRLAAADLLGVDGDDWEATATEETRDSTEYRTLVTLGWLQEELVAALET